MNKRIPDAARQGIIDKLILIGQIDGGLGSYYNFFKRVCPQADEISYGRNETLLSAIARHCDSFPGDWGDENGMFSEIDVLNWSDEQFLFFCSEYVNPVFNRYEWNEELEERINLQSKCVDAINLYLVDCGYELKFANKIGDKFEYELVQIKGVHGSIQGIVFAAVGKPDILFTDFLNRKVEIPISEDKYLLYDEKINSNGLSWQKLKLWYDEHHIAEDKSFLERIQESVDHGGSPIEKQFFEYYLDYVSDRKTETPALLPQVYLYYDSKIQRERTITIFDHQCMDFLFVFSESQRIVIELDGQQHYAEDERLPIEGRPYLVQIASPPRYAAMVKAQRDMTLAGYEVYRFGGSEFRDADEARRVIKQFFSDLLKKHGIV